MKPDVCALCGEPTGDLERCSVCDFWVCPKCRIQNICRECRECRDRDAWNDGEEEARVYC